MAESMLSFLYAELAYSIAFNILFGAFFIRQVLKLDKLGQNLDVTIPRKIWLKFSIILAIISLLVLHLVLSYTFQSYWLFDYSNFSLVIFLFIVNYTMQGYIVLKLVTKGYGRRYLPNLCYWLFCMGAAIIQLIAEQTLVPDPNFTVTIQLLIALLNFSLLFISLIFDKIRPTPDIVRSLTDSDTGRTIEDSFHRWDRVAPPNRLFIEFNQIFDIKQANDSLVCQFKIAVYVDQNATIINKSDTDFVKLGIALQKIFPSRPEVALPESSKKYSNMLTYGEEKLKTYQTYLLDLIRTGEFITPCLLDFLEVPANLRAKLILHQRRQTIIRQQTGFTEQEEKIRKPFFLVYCQKGKYILQNPDFLQFIINRTTAEIMQLSNRLKDQKRLTIDILPQNPQEQDIINFFYIVVNRKSLWRSFACWFRLDIQLENKVYNYFDPWMLGFRHISIDIIGHEIVFDADGKIHTCYLLSIKNNPGKESFLKHDDDRGITLKKRYSEFCTLDKHIRRFMNKNKMNMDNFPALPPKFSPFGSKSSPKSRQIRFGIYMKSLLKIQGINHCIKLLQFLQFDSLKQVEPAVEFEPVVHDSSEISYFSDLNQKH